MKEAKRRCLCWGLGLNRPPHDRGLLPTARTHCIVPPPPPRGQGRPERNRFFSLLGTRIMDSTPLRGNPRRLGVTDGVGA